MCRYFTIVAQIGDYQYVGCCEHGTVHLGWYYGAIHLRPADFVHIYHLLERSLSVPDFKELPGKGCSLARQQNGCFQLWLGNAILFLTEADLPRLVELVRLAVPSLNHFWSENSGGMWPDLNQQAYCEFHPVLSDAWFGLN